jgi:hypothetical protein
MSLHIGRMSLSDFLNIMESIVDCSVGWRLQRAHRPRGKRPPETEINGLEKNPSTGINPGLGFLLDNSKLNYLRSFKICLSLNRSLIR